MRRYKLFLGVLIILAVAISVFLRSPTAGYAQTNQDWSDPVNLSLSGSATNPMLVVDSTGTIHAIWVDTFDKAYKYSQSTDGKTWSPSQTVAFPFSPKDPPPVLLADPNGAIHIFWISSNKELFYGQTTSSNFGNPRSWNTTTSLARDVLSFDVILDSHSALNIAYVKKSSLADIQNPAGVYFRQSIIGGGSWSKPIQLYASEYFRSTAQNDTYIRVSTTKFQGNERIYVTWDNRAQKRVFMAVSGDNGSTWSGAQQIKGPEDTGGVSLPFNLTVAAADNNVLLIWEVGEPGADACTVYSQWSIDGGKSWADLTAALGGRSECPVGIRIVDRNKGYISVLLIGEINPILIAWNGEKWSDIQAQIQLPPLSNPLTLDAVMLGCQFDFFYKQQAYVIGCDQSTGGDVWFLSRSLEPVEAWFSPLPIWGVANTLSVQSEKPKRISYFSSVADATGNIHAMWSEVPINADGATSNSIEYARWDGKQWTNPVAIFRSLGGPPSQLLLTANPLGRLLVTWIDSYNGDLIFSWANLEKAGLSSEWAKSSGLPSPSRLISSPNSVVDGSGRIITVYAVPINEGRGIFVVQSTDNGSSWSTPVQVFDAVAAGWERIDEPRLSLSSDGTLHLIFIRQTILQTGQPMGLYYSRSVDGGASWSVPQVISEGDIQWADIASYGAKTVHVVWQEYDGLVFANLSQVSQDGGTTWGKQNNVTGVNNVTTRVALASDGRGLLHFVQLVNKGESLAINQQNLILQDWTWDGNAWRPDLSNNVTIRGNEVTYSMAANITSTGFLDVFIPVEYTDPVKGIKDEILMFSRYLEETDKEQAAQIAIIPTSITGNPEDGVNVLQPTPTSTPGVAIPYDTKSMSSLQRNIIGAVLIGISAIVALIFVIRRRPNGK